MTEALRAELLNEYFYLSSSYLSQVSEKTQESTCLEKKKFFFNLVCTFILQRGN